MGTTLLDPQGRVLEANAALCQFLGRPRDTLLGAELVALTHPDEAGPLGSGQAERRFVHADGGAVWAVTSAVEWADAEPGCLLVCVDDVTSRRHAERLLLHAALHDSLTNLPNRRLLRDRLDTALARAERSTKTLAVLFIDLDDFKQVNDTLGHDAGDEMLVAVARNIIAVLRSCDTVARLGGDEFVVICEDVTAEGEISRLAGRLLEAIRRPVELRGQEVVVTASIGVAVPGRALTSSDELIRLADQAMYRAKRQPDLDYVLAEDHAPSSSRAELVAELRAAIEAERLELHYQPVVRFDGTVLGLEALLRWPHPRLGLLPPRDFLHLVAETGLAGRLTDWVLRTAVDDAASWRDPDLPVSVNMWAGEVARPGFADTVCAVLERAGLQPGALHLELHEQDLSGAGRSLGEELRRLRAAGVGLAIDDFGSGRAAVADLRRLPVDTVKIDRSFVATVCNDPADAAIVEAIAATARAAGRHPLASGVETVAELALLRELGYESVQGYLLARPSPLAGLQDVIATRRVRLPQS